MQPERPTISRQISVINNCSLFRQDAYELSAINRRLNSATLVTPKSSSSSISTCENNVSDIPKRKRVTFSLNPNLMIHEGSDTDSNNVIGECVVINNEKTVVEIEVES